MDPNANPFIPSKSQQELGPIGSRRPSAKSSHAVPITQPSAQNTPHSTSTSSDGGVRLDRTVRGTAHNIIPSSDGGVRLRHTDSSEDNGSAMANAIVRSFTPMQAPQAAQSSSSTIPKGPRAMTTTGNEKGNVIGGPSGPRGAHVGAKPLNISSASGQAPAQAQASPNLGFAQQSQWFNPNAASAFASPGTEKPSVKHLTCFYWHKFGKCRFANNECLYSHYNTGQLAEAPQKVEAGGPSVAGRNLTALTIHKSASEQQGINLPPGWSSPSFQPRPLPFRSPHTPLASPVTQYAKITYTPQNTSPIMGPKVELTMGQAHQLYATLHHVEQQAIKKLEVCKHNYETAKFLSGVVKGNPDHGIVASDMLTVMQKEFEGLHAALEDIQKKMEHCKELLKPKGK